MINQSAVIYMKQKKTMFYIIKKLLLDKINRNYYAPYDFTQNLGINLYKVRKARYF